MNMQDMITLRSVAVEVDSYGVPQETTSDTEVYARVESVSASEFFEGGQNGFKPEYRFLVNAWEYSDEPDIVYQDKVYSVYRTYRRNLDLLELYVERKAGRHAAELTDADSGDSK